MLPDILEYSIFVLYGKGEASAAGEQLVSNSHSYWNCNMAEYFSVYINKSFPVTYASKNSFFWLLSVLHWCSTIDTK